MSSSACSRGIDGNTPTARGPGRLPDFIIIGAMKSGTSSLHYLLSRHPRVFIPPQEIYFFDIDDIEQHPDFFVRVGDEWTYHDYERGFDRYVEWYRSFFADARPDQLIGEDTVTYLASREAAGRIARLLPEVKLIAVLRDPVARAYSHYWHLVATGRATMTFEDTLRYCPENILRRSRYREQIERFQRHFDEDRLEVVLFEDLVSGGQRVIDAVCAFLGLEPIDLTGVDYHRNSATAPLNLRARLLANRALRQLVMKGYDRRLPNMPGYDPTSVRTRFERHPLSQGLAEAFDRLRPRRRYPPMRAETRRFLEKLLRRHNEGLSELIGRDVSERWPWMASE